ncbi:MAG TPA: hypothetical protein VLA93_12655 [Pyrinomonadaceae bacterium]|nr:hypothetical protein [Pyrinomonadaceae bacterium]
MRHSRSAVVLLLILVTLTVGLAVSQEQSPNRARPEQLRVVSYQGDLRALLGSLADSFGIVIGFETESHLPSMVKVEARDVNFRQLLDVIVLGHPQYRWREVDGTIEFTPVSGGSAVLDTVIRNFEVKDAHFSEATDSLLNLPEVQGSLAAIGLIRNEAGYQPRSLGSTFSLHLEQLTVRRALHEIARKSGTNFWVFRQFGNKERFFSLRTSL